MISPIGGTDNDGEDTIEELGWYTDVPYPGGGDGRSGHAGGGYLRILPPEHRHVIYCDKAHYGPVSDGVAVPRSVGFEAVAGTGGS